MPLYMDFHKIAGLTMEDVRKAHLADVFVQEKYGVKYHQFWLNQEAGTIFCLTEGPDMETCAMVHRLAHGNVACAMTEVQPGYYKIFMGEGHELDDGIVRNRDGSTDLGYRTIITVKLVQRINPNASEVLQQFPTSGGLRKIVLRMIDEFNGRELNLPGDDVLIGVFNDASQAARCARNIQKALLSLPEACFSIGLSAGQPVTGNGEFFTKALALARHLCLITGENQICVSALVKDLCKNDELTDQKPLIRSVTSYEEHFVSELMTLIQGNLSNESFSLDTLCQDMGVSRPQLYRRIRALTGRSPNDLLRDLRMDKAFNLLKRKTGNISEISLEVGYQNPSYFARCFTRKFGCSPSRFVGLSNHIHTPA
jgi:AraC-like DNA-binding protein